MDDDSNNGLSVQAERPKIILRTENEAWKLLESVIAEKGATKAYDVSFTDWVGFGLKAHLRYDQSITPSFMDAFQELQKTIYRAYALVKYDSTDSKLLTDDEKRQLEISVKVDEGSSDYSIPNSLDITTLLQSTVNKMTGDQVWYLGILIALLWFGTSVTRAGLQHFLEKRKTELRSKERVAELENEKFADEEETKRLHVVQQIASKNDIAATLLGYTKDVQRDFLKAIAHTQSATYAGVDVSSHVANELSIVGKKQESQGRIDGVFVVRSMDAGKPDMFRARLESVDGNNPTLTAQLADDMLAKNDGEVLWDAFRHRTPLQFQINVEKTEDKITRGHIIHVEPVHDEP